MKTSPCNRRAWCRNVVPAFSAPMIRKLGLTAPAAAGGSGLSGISSPYISGEFVDRCAHPARATASPRVEVAASVFMLMYSRPIVMYAWYPYVWHDNEVHPHGSCA